MGIIETLVVGLIVAAMAVLVGWRLWRSAMGRERCGGCAGACFGRPPGPTNSTSSRGSKTGSIS